MVWDWQQVVALACVAGAVFIICRRVHRWWKGSAAGGCAAGCQTCAIKDPAAPAVKPLVTLNRSHPKRGDDRGGA